MESIYDQTEKLVSELVEASKLKKDDLIVIGCSSSEVIGEKIGTHGNADAAGQIFDAVYSVCKKNGLHFAAQCCEHLNRALIVDEKTAKLYNLQIVNVIPHPKAGGSFATAAYNGFENPVAVENLRHKAAAGLDIGGTLIGMHLREVAVPLRLSEKKLGEAIIIAARTRPKFVGGVRAIYNEDLL